MTLSIVHRGHELTQQQLDALIPVLNRSMRGEINKRKFEAECDKALEAAGCPVPSNALKTHPCRSCGQETEIDDLEKFDPEFHHCNRHYRCIP